MSRINNQVTRIDNFYPNMSTREIARSLGIADCTAHAIKHYGSTRQYKDYLAQQKGFDSHLDYRNSQRKLK